MAPFVMNDTLSHWVDGLSMLPRAFVMPHFDALEMYEPGLRDRFIGSAPAGSTPVGIDEDTALLGDGETWTVRGAGAVWVGHDLVPYRDGDRFELVLR